NAKAKEVRDLKKKNSDLAGVVQTSRCKARESRRREKLAEDATLKLERELEVMKSTFDEALMKAVDEVAMKEKDRRARLEAVLLKKHDRDMLKLHRIYIEEKRALAAKQKASSMKARAT
ncbi:hypothetical protein ACHAW6_006624, partial [Cyclotella cf. meneghiniana]